MTSHDFQNYGALRKCAVIVRESRSAALRIFAECAVLANNTADV